MASYIYINLTYSGGIVMLMNEKREGFGAAKFFRWSSSMYNRKRERRLGRFPCSTVGWRFHDRTPLHLEERRDCVIFLKIVAQRGNNKPLGQTFLSSPISALSRARFSLSLSLPPRGPALLLYARVTPEHSRRKNNAERNRLLKIREGSNRE